MLSCCPYACYLYCPSLTFVFLLHIGAQLVLLNSDWWSNWPASQHKGTCWSWSSEKSFLVLPLFTIQSTEGSPYYLLRLFDAHLFKSGLLFWAICFVFFKIGTWCQLYYVHYLWEIVSLRIKIVCLGSSIACFSYWSLWSFFCSNLFLSCKVYRVKYGMMEFLLYAWSKS